MVWHGCNGSVELCNYRRDLHRVREGEDVSGKTIQHAEKVFHRFGFLQEQRRAILASEIQALYSSKNHFLHNFSDQSKHYIDQTEFLVSVPERDGNCGREG